MAIMPRYQSSDIAVATPQGQFRDVSAPMDQLSAQMDRMTGFFIQEAKQQAIVQAEEYAADKAPTIQQIEEARRLNQPIAPIADKTTLFGRAANEAQSRILAKNVAAAADMQMAQLQQDVSAGKVRVNDIANQTNALIKGYSSALAEVDPMIARSLEADLALSGNRLFVSATKAAAVNAAERQQQMVSDSIKTSIPLQVAQIFAAGPINMTGPNRENIKIDEVSQIKSVIERATEKANSLPKGKREQAIKDIRTSLKEGAERYGQEIVIKGGLNDLKVLDAQIRSGKFDFAMTDPNDRLTLLGKVKTQINELEKAPKKLNQARQEIVNEIIANAKAQHSIGNFNVTNLPDRALLEEIHADDPVALAKAIDELNAIKATEQLGYEFQFKSKAQREASLAAQKEMATDKNSVAMYKSMQAVSEAIDKDFKQDAAKASLKFAEVKTAYDLLLDAKRQEAENTKNNVPTDPKLISQATQEYAAATRRRQLENGVLESDVKYFTDEWVNSYKETFNNQIQSGINAADYFASEAKFWGPLFPKLVKEMKLGTEMNVIAGMTSSLATRRDAQILANAAQPDNKKALIATFGSERNKIEQSLAPLMKDFSQSLKFTLDGPIVANSISEASILLAMAKMNSGDASGPADAAKQAFQSIIGEAYEFGTGFRIPRNLGKGLSTERIEFNADFIRANINHFRDKLEIPVGLTSVSQGIAAQPGEVVSEKEKDIYVDSIAAHGGWINTGDDSYGLRLVDALGYPVRLKDGTPIEMTWADLNNKGFDELMDIQSSSGMFTILPAELQGATEETNQYNIAKKKLLDSYRLKPLDAYSLKNQ